MPFFVLLTFFAGLTLFNVGGTVPSTGLGEVEQAPLVETTGRARLAIKPLHVSVLVAGRGFKPAEMVRLTGGNPVRVRASVRGTFQFRLHTDPCKGFTIRAVGSKGSRASAQYAPGACVEQ
jgi:hypothetical protein